MCRFRRSITRLRPLLMLVVAASLLSLLADFRPAYQGYVSESGEPNVVPEIHESLRILDASIDSDEARVKSVNNEHGYTRLSDTNLHLKQTAHHGNVVSFVQRPEPEGEAARPNRRPLNQPEADGDAARDDRVMMDLRERLKQVRVSSCFRFMFSYT